MFLDNRGRKGACVAGWSMQHLHFCACIRDSSVHGSFVFQALWQFVQHFTGVPTFNSSMVAESDDNVTITWVFNGNGLPFISANVSTNCETSTGISSVYSSITGTQVIKFTQKPPPDTRCTVTVHVANLLGSIDRQYNFTVPESKCIIYIRSTMHITWSWKD